MEQRFPSLCFPMHPLQMRRGEKDVEVFDPVRKRWLVLTPEEWVRQHLILHLHIDLGHPISLMTTERAASRGSRPGRTDLVCHGTDGKPFILAECKAPAVALSNEALLQAAAYNARIGATHVAVTNGLQLHCASLSGNGMTWSSSLPAFPHTP